MKLKSLLLGALLCLLAQGAAAAAPVVRVGGYNFPPFVFFNHDGSYSGLTLDMIQAMNRFQDDYRFRFVPTSAQRRYRGMERGAFQMIFFESVLWGWQGRKVKPTRVYLKGGEVFIARKLPGRTTAYFDFLGGKRIIGILGYHYAFANFRTDPDYLRRIFNMVLTTSPSGNIMMVIRGRADIAVVTKSYLELFLKKHPAYRKLLMVSPRMDQIYHHTILVKDGTRPGVDEMNQLLDAMERAGVLHRLWRKYGLSCGYGGVHGDTQ